MAKCPEVGTEWLNKKGTFSTSSKKQTDLTDKMNRTSLSWWRCATGSHQLNQECGAERGWRHGKQSLTGTSCEHIANITLQRFSGHEDKKSHSHTDTRPQSQFSSLVHKDDDAAILFYLHQSLKPRQCTRRLVCNITSLLFDMVFLCYFDQSGGKQPSKNCFVKRFLRLI